MRRLRREVDGKGGEEHSQKLREKTLEGLDRVRMLCEEAHGLRQDMEANCERVDAVIWTVFFKKITVLLEVLCFLRIPLPWPWPAGPPSWEGSSRG